jgi:DNA polymerase-3 subunit gamma/tau
MAYTVIARKYRPQKFSDITAQEHITLTLQNAIRTGRIAHAYIFSGSRGVGKTTAARILAKTINCEKVLADTKTFNNAEPCGTCDSCKEFDEGRSYNIFEIDAASKNKVEDIRSLIENIQFAPAKGRYKVYIIDEFHMITTQAFNAFLKTLEEPPKHAIFIFATTELHKVPDTISSRCQRFNFKRISAENISKRLREICNAEKISIDDDSLMLIGKKADGAMRDAQSLLDQIISFCGTTIDYAKVSEMLNAISDEHYFDVTDSVLQKDGAKMLAVANFIFENGFDVGSFLQGLIEHFRNLLVVKTVRSSRLINAAETVKKRYEADAEKFSVELLTALAGEVSAAEKDIRLFKEPHLKFELTLLKLVSLALQGDYAERLAQLEEKLMQLSDELKKKATRIG